WMAGYFKNKYPLYCTLYQYGRYGTVFHVSFDKHNWTAQKIPMVDVRIYGHNDNFVLAYQVGQVDELAVKHINFFLTHCLIFIILINDLYIIGDQDKQEHFLREVVVIFCGQPHVDHYLDIYLIVEDPTFVVGRASKCLSKSRKEGIQTIKLKLIMIGHF
ncbi:hypothetical protein ACJX0J_039516, partial [Zea mays]